MSPYVELNFPTEEDPRDRRRFLRWPIWACGFRPFFLGGAVLAALSVAAWLYVFFGGVAVGGPAGSIGWHAHEMVFGFTTAIIAGFLLTAVPKWTRTPRLEGTTLAALFGLWLAGRISMALSELLPYGLVAVVDSLFLPALALAIAIPIARARTVRNLGFIPLLFALAGANTFFHLAHVGVVPAQMGASGLDAGLAVIIVIIAVVGGRVIPFFTANRLGLRAIDRRRPVDIAALSLSVLWLFCFVLWPSALFTALSAIGAGVANLGRMWGWASRKTAGVPLLWVLHVGYAFVGIGLILYGMSVFDVMATRSVALHGLTTGAIGVLCLGMMARVSLGHSGRELRAHPATAVAFGLIAIAALLRTFVPLFIPWAYDTAVMASGVFWTGAWMIFVVIYLPILISRRTDGRPG